MKVFNIRLSAWLGISICLLLACQTRQKLQKEEPSQIQNPKPLMDAKTDSLKQYLDEERLRRKQQGKE
ncbi:MAG: hypothetical protein ACOVK9_03735 [Bacteroidia bacterium]